MNTLNLVKEIYNKSLGNHYVKSYFKAFACVGLAMLL